MESKSKFAGRRRIISKSRRNKSAGDGATYWGAGLEFVAGKRDVFESTIRAGMHGLTS